MKRRLISLVLTTVMCLTLCAPALAAEPIDNLSTKNTFGGYTFTEELAPNGDYIINSYYLGEHQKQYTIRENDVNIYVQDMTTRSGENSYTIPSAKNYTTQENRDTRAERWASAGDIYYNSSAIVGGTVRAIMMAYGDNRTSSVVMQVENNEALDDVVAFFSSFIIGEGFLRWAAIAGFTVTSLSATFVAAVVSSVGSTIVGGLIKGAFTETVSAQETVWKFRATPQTENGYGTSVILEDQGSSFYMYLPDTSEWDSWSEPYTLYDWAHVRFAELVWNELYPYYTYPGVSRFVTTFPHQ